MLKVLIVCRALFISEFVLKEVITIVTKVHGN